MGEVRRIFVEKNEGFDVEATGIKHDLLNLLGIKGIEKLRLVNRYDIEGISDLEYENARLTIFSEPPVDHFYDEVLPLNGNERMFGYEYLPGQYDQRADSCEQCLQLSSEKNKPTVRSARIIVIEGNISDAEFELIKNHLINPVDSHIASLEKPETLQMQLITPEDVKILEGFCQMDEDKRLIFMKSSGLAMNLEDLEFVQKYFKSSEERDPTETEIRVIDTYWSDHCRHTTFLSKINSLEISDSPYLTKCKDAYKEYLNSREIVYGKDSGRDINLMDMAVIAMKELRKAGLLDDLEVSDEINACSIIVDVDVNGKNEEWLLMFKNETHNHPTEIEPFGGAATCLGGAIRDPLSGRSYVYQAMRVTGSGDPRESVSDTIPGKLPQIRITREAAHGYSSYGNQIGLATGQVYEFYDDGFKAKRMEIGAVIGAVPRKNVKRLDANPGDIVLLVGGRTGRDGCGGATGSSKEHNEESLTNCGAEVQKGNPPTERKIQRLFRNPKASKIIKKCNDFGAGGVSVAIGELAPGLVIDLDKVLKKYEGLNGTELAISESQERMAVVVEPEKAEYFSLLASEENLECEKVADITSDNRLVMQWRGKTIVDLSREFLDTNGVTQQINVKITNPSDDIYFERKFEKNVLDRLKNLSACSQKGLAERFDSTIGAGTVLMPFGGKNQITPQAGMVAKLPVPGGKTKTCSVMTFGYNPLISKWSPFHGAVYAVLESVSKIAAMGGDVLKIRLTLQEYFERLGTNPEKWGKPAAALLGAFYAQKKLGIAAIGGKDSMSGTFGDLNVPPTLVSFAVTVANLQDIVSTEFKKTSNQVVLIECKYDSDWIPDFEYIKNQYHKFNKMIKEGLVYSAMPLGEGGIAEAVAKMALGNSIGFEVEKDFDKQYLNRPLYGCIIAEVRQSCGFRVIGKTKDSGKIDFGKNEFDLKSIEKTFITPLESVFATSEECCGPGPFEKLCNFNNINISLSDKRKPCVVIPIFPGTNCEYDTTFAFEKAGATVNTLVFRNLTPNDIHESVQTLKRLIGKSNIIAFPGGFSAGDEPEGSGKFIATVFRNRYLEEEVMKLLNVRRGLIIGICNGFQALIKLGLLPYGVIKPMEFDSPTLTFNTIGRHVSCMTNTKVVSNKSPWLRLVNTGDIHTIPISHGEGRFIADKNHFDVMFQNGQIATQYVDFNGIPTYDSRFNPNGSMHAVEGITSPDGRVFGKMGHSERIGEGLYKNIPGNKEQRIFEAGVGYFK